MKTIIFSFVLVLANSAFANCVSEMMPKAHGNRDLAQQMCRTAEKACNISEIIKAHPGINYSQAWDYCAKSAAAEQITECMAQGNSYSTCQQN
ncbi:hypothetical protein [Bdellovibrio sp. HCB337]|uniref:hypothetical protein n=1 Tax=Bdellovibrio sp. HCB337 TaxID=3394358 RepID=UPI0039A413D6